MSLSDDLDAYVRDVFGTQWTLRKGRKIPSPADLPLGNTAIELERATVLYADMEDSTKLVKNFKYWFSANIYKTYLYCAARIIRYKGGTIVSYDGDRIMGLFIGDSQTTSAMNAGLGINYAVTEIIKNRISKRYPNTKYTFNHNVAIDTSKIYAARTGVRGDNDIVWIGDAANKAAKLSTINDNASVWMTNRAYNKTNSDERYSSDGSLMWKERTWTPENETIWCSTWWRRP